MIVPSTAAAWRARTRATEGSLNSADSARSIAAWAADSYDRHVESHSGSVGTADSSAASIHTSPPT